MCGWWLPFNGYLFPLCVHRRGWCYSDIQPKVSIERRIIAQNGWLPLRNHSQRQKWGCRGRQEASHWFRRSILSRWICCWRTCSQNSFAHWTPQNWHWIPTYCHFWTIWNVAIFFTKTQLLTVFAKQKWITLFRLPATSWVWTALRVICETLRYNNWPLSPLLLFCLLQRMNQSS